MNVRRLGAEELDILKQLRLTSLRLEPDNYASDYDDWAAKNDDAWRVYLDEPVFAAFDNTRAIGLLGLIPQTKSRMAHRASLGMVWVAPEARGMGAADLLLRAAIDHARSLGVDQLELSVNAENARAVRFYQRHGFDAYGRLPRGFRTSKGFVDDLLMARRIDP